MAVEQTEELRQTEIKPVKSLGLNHKEQSARWTMTTHIFGEHHRDRLFHLPVDLGWVDFDLGVLPFYSQIPASARTIGQS